MLDFPSTSSRDTRIPAEKCSSCIIWTDGYRRDLLVGTRYCHYYHCFFLSPLTARMLLAISTRKYGVRRATISNKTHVNIAQYHNAQLAAPLETLLAIIQPQAKAKAQPMLHRSSCSLSACLPGQGASLRTSPRCAIPYRHGKPRNVTKNKKKKRPH